MFFLDSHYVSPLLAQTLENNVFSVYDMKKNKVLRGSTEELSANVIMNSEKAFSVFASLYEKDYPEIVACSKIFKNKILFREKLASYYPNFYFKRVTFPSLETLDFSTLPYPLIIKPAKGYSSVGVFLIEEASQFQDVIRKLHTEITNTTPPEELSFLNEKEFLLESYISGQEYAVDMYYDANGQPVILNLFTRTFKDKNDMSDRVYYTSKAILQNNLVSIESYLRSLQQHFSIPAMPLHIELRINEQNEIIPIEINPLRFAGEGTTELGFYAYNVDSYEYFIAQKAPDWPTLIADMDDQLYAFTCASFDMELAQGQPATIDHASLKKQFPLILSYRELPVASFETFAVIFYKCQSVEDFTPILDLQFVDFIRTEQQINKKVVQL